MKKLHLLKTILLLCALIVGSNCVWAALVPAYTLNPIQSGSNTAYGTNYDVTIGGITWNAPGNQNFDGYWRIGGKKSKAADPTFSAARILTGKGAITGQIKKVTFNHNGKSTNGIGVPSVTLTIASDAAFNSIVDEVVVNNPTISTSTSGSFDFTPTSPLTYWNNCFYKFTINITNTTTSGGGLDLTSIVFYEEGADVPITEIILPATADVPVGKTRTLTATVAPHNHTGSLDWESDNTSIATVSSEGVVTGVAVGSTTIRAKSHSNNAINRECTVTVGEDVATLPFNWAGGSRTNLLALYGVTGNGLGDYADNASNRPYLVKFDTDGDYIQIRTNGQPGKVAVEVKKMGDATSKIKVQESSDGTDFTDLEEFTISGTQNDEVDFKTTKAFKPESQYVRIYKSLHESGGNIGVGPISIALPEPADPTVIGETVTVPVSVNMDGWRSFIGEVDQNYTIESGAKVYYVSETNAGTKKVTLAEIADGIPANTPVILHKDGATSITLTKTATVIAAPSGNKLEVTTTITDLSTGVYRLGYKTSDGVGFYKYSTASAPAGIIYISALDAGANFLSFDFGDVTGIESLTLDPSPKGEGSEYYNLNGQRVAQPAKGLYIVNGKKVVIK